MMKQKVAILSVKSLRFSLKTVWKRLSCIFSRFSSFTSLGIFHVYVIFTWNENFPRVSCCFYMVQWIVKMRNSAAFTLSVVFQSLKYFCSANFVKNFQTLSLKNSFILKKLVFISLSNVKIMSRGGRACSKLGAQINNESLKSGCAKSAIYYIEAQKVGAQMRTLAH